MVDILVHITFEDGKRIRCAKLSCPEPGDRRGATFQYDPEYLKNPKAHALDPVKLPLESGPTPVRTPSGFPQAIQDSLPDRFGMGLLKQRARQNRLRPDEVPAHLLIAMGNGAMGALDFQPCKGKRLKGPPGCGLPQAQIREIAQAAIDYDAGRPLSNSQFQCLLDASTAPGGARPKALVQDENGKLYLAKFSRDDDRMDIVRLEAASLTVATWAGLPVPEHKIVSAGRHTILMVERFDRTGANLQGHRHRISFDTLLRNRDDEAPREGYGDIAEAIRDWSAQPHTDIEHLYRLMCLNVLVGNTDDHLRNFSLIRKDGGWRLSPVYDVLPYHHERLAHSILLPGNPPTNRPPEENTLSTLVNMGRQMRIPKAKAIVEQVSKAASRWQEACALHGVPNIQAALTGRYIQQRRGDNNPSQGDEEEIRPTPR